MRRWSSSVDEVAIRRAKEEAGEVSARLLSSLVVFGKRASALSRFRDYARTSRKSQS
jgi:hypothetical protein